MGAKTKAAVLAIGVGALIGIVLAQYSMGRHREDLFSRRPLRRLSALGYLSGHPSVEAVRLLRDYLAWEEHPMLRRRAEAIVRRMEARLA
ncbi:MAG TPA: hypothetical protein VJL31_16455 [Gemmatimonadales bacterium]|jgi:hypothetical protein|nr:hypothetical protein [Gemmatimonadales bacterium]